MKFRIFPLWWPLLLALSPVIIPLLIIKNLRYKKNLLLVEEANKERMAKADNLTLPELSSLELTVLSEEKVKEGFKNEAGVSYYVKSNKGSLLFDVGFGPDHETLGHNARKLGFTIDEADALVISHLHPDHMGGLKAKKSKTVIMPQELGSPNNKTCFLPDQAEAPGFFPEVVSAPGMLVDGIASTGPLGRSLFFFGLTEEQALVARLKGKGLVIITGCGHPTIEVILEMVRRISNEPIHAIVGGLHFPVSEGRGWYAGIQAQMLLGTGLPPWKKINDDDLGKTISAINEAGPKHIYLSAHDTCDYAVERFEKELDAEVEVLLAGEMYAF
ncbi:MAG: MBL fold metallo-hydrolase [bacterium]|nr:MBL fold metallo-hydrolase [bacterium]